jgi:hypothetical protein
MHPYLSARMKNARVRVIADRQKRINRRWLGDPDQKSHRRCAAGQDSLHVADIVPNARLIDRGDRNMKACLDGAPWSRMLLRLANVSGAVMSSAC